MIGAPVAHSTSVIVVRGERRPWPVCRRCGSSLAGRLVEVRELDGEHELDVFGCPCGRRRLHTRRVAAADKALAA